MAEALAKSQASSRSEGPSTLSSKNSTNPSMYWTEEEAPIRELGS